jgi:hypothetical protein
LANSEAVAVDGSYATLLSAANVYKTTCWHTRATLYERSPFDGATLKGAMVGGRLLVPPSVWTNKQTPDGAVKAVRYLIALGDPNMPRQPHAAFLLQGCDTSRQGFQTFSTAHELHEALLRIRQGDDYGGFWDDLKEFAGDVWEGVKSATVSVAGVAANVAEPTVNLFIRDAGRVSQGLLDRNPNDADVLQLAGFGGAS